MRLRCDKCPDLWVAWWGSQEGCCTTGRARCPGFLAAPPPTCPRARGPATARTAWSRTATTAHRRANGSGASGRPGSTASCQSYPGARPKTACATRATPTCPRTEGPSPRARHRTQVRLPRPRGRDSPHRRRCRRVEPAGGAASPRRLGASPPGRRLGRQHRRRVAGHLRTGRDGGARGDRLARDPGAGLDPVHGHQHLDRDHLGRLQRAGRLRLLPREGTRSPAGVGAGRLPPGHPRRVGGLPATARHEHRTGPGHQRRRR
jgi:hypothetical protein